MAAARARSFLPNNKRLGPAKPIGNVDCAVR
jgi:hypothetical protein